MSIYDHEHEQRAVSLKEAALYRQTCPPRPTSLILPKRPTLVWRAFLPSRKDHFALLPGS